MGRFIKRPSPGTVIATIALFVALGGVAVALPGTNSVKNDDVKDLQFQNLNLKNGWQQYGFGTGKAKVAIDAQGVVVFRGAIAQPTGANSNAFRLPAQFRPNREVWVATDMFGASNGRFQIRPDGQVFVQADIDQGLAQQFTSLDGPTFSRK
jgi:hypothetical protein